MRKLNSKQKKLLKAYARLNKAEGNLDLSFKAEDMLDYWEIYELNPFEDFNSAVERFVHSLLVGDMK